MRATSTGQVAIRLAQTHDTIKDVADLPRDFIDDLTAFFSDYNKLHDKKFECVGIFGSKKAQRLLKAAEQVFAGQRK